MFRAGEMALQGKALAVKPDVLSSIPGTSVGEGEPTPANVPRACTYIPHSDIQH